MGWKAVKNHYQIKHIVQVADADISIGSPYVSGLIIISNGQPQWGMGISSPNPDLLRYFNEMNDDLALLKSLIDVTDTFEKSIPVYTYCNGEVVKSYCEELGWPNCTHDGKIMYENTFFADQNDALLAGIRNAQAAVELTEDNVERLQVELKQNIQLLDRRKANLVSLMALKFEVAE